MTGNSNIAHKTNFMATKTLTCHWTLKSIEEERFQGNIYFLQNFYTRDTKAVQHRRIELGDRKCYLSLFYADHYIWITKFVKKIYFLNLSSVV